MMFSRLLVVCTGNICRSPVAEALLKARISQTVESAGLGALVGQGVDPSAGKLAEAEGLDVSHHKARQISVQMIRDADLILVMSEDQRRAIGQLAPEATGKTMLFGRWLGGGVEGAKGLGEEIPDPFRKSFQAFEHVHRQLVRAADSWQGKLG